MAINTTLESASTTAASNGPSGSDQRTLADDGLRQYLAFIKSLKTLAVLASATTVTPPSTANAFSVTGTTAITTIASTNSWDGRDILFIFAGILTLTNGSNLILPGSANITTAAGDAAWLVQVASGQWRVVGYSRADGSWAYGNITASAFIPSGSTVPTNGLYLKAANNPALSSNTTLRWDVNSTGNHVFAAPSAGTTVTATAPAAGTSQTWTDGTRIASLTHAAGVVRLRTTTTDSLELGANSTSAVAIANGGNVTINAPSSGRTVTINSTVADYAAVFENTNAAFGSALITSNSGTANLVLGSSKAFVGGGVLADAFIGVNGAHLLQLGNTAIGVAFAITSDGRLYGTALHNNAGTVTGTTNQYIASGTYTPTATAGTNITSATGVSGRWNRVGNVVYVSGTVTIDPTSASTNSDCGISLPIASNLGGSNLDGIATIGQGTQIGQVVAVIGDDVANDRAQLSWISGTDVASRNWKFTFQYEVL